MIMMLVDISLEKENICPKGCFKTVIIAIILWILASFSYPSSSAVWYAIYKLWIYFSYQSNMKGAEIHFFGFGCELLLTVINLLQSEWSSIKMKCELPKVKKKRNNLFNKLAHKAFFSERLKGNVIHLSSFKLFFSLQNSNVMWI